MLLAYRRSLREYKSPPDPGESLREMVAKAVIDPYHRANKSSRDYPRKKQEPRDRSPEDPQRDERSNQRSQTN